MIPTCRHSSPSGSSTIGATRYWESLTLLRRLGEVDVPCLHVGGWFDIFLEGTLASYSALRERSGEKGSAPQHLVVGPWQHVPWARLNGSVDYGPNGDNRIEALQVAWFDRWLKGREPSRSPPVRYFVTGAGEWRENATWPPTGAQPLEIFLRSSGRANSLSGDGRLSLERPADEPPDIFIFDPFEPVPSLGGASCCGADVAPVGVFDQRVVEIRNDILVYTSPPLVGELDVAGQVELVLFAATDGPSTDWTAKLVDVHPDGMALNICDGIVRSRFRESLSEPSLLTPGRVYEYPNSTSPHRTLLRMWTCDPARGLKLKLSDLRRKLEHRGTRGRRRSFQRAGCHPSCLPYPRPRFATPAAHHRRSIDRAIFAAAKKETDR